MLNKMDTSEAEFQRIQAEYLAFAANLGPARILGIPVAPSMAIMSRARAMLWYRGPTLIEHLETVEIGLGIAEKPFRMPVQWVNRPDATFCGYAGTIVGGTVHPGDRLAVLPARGTVEVVRAVAFEQDLPQAQTGQAVTLTLAEEVDIGRGDVLAAYDARPFADQFCTHMLWMSEQPMLPERSHLMQIATAAVPAQVTELKHKINVGTSEHVAAFELNEVAVCKFRPRPRRRLRAYAESRDMGAFIPQRPDKQRDGRMRDDRFSIAPCRVLVSAHQSASRQPRLRLDNARALPTSLTGPATAAEADN